MRSLKQINNLLKKSKTIRTGFKIQQKFLLLKEQEKNRLNNEDQLWKNWKKMSPIERLNARKIEFDKRKNKFLLKKGKDSRYDQSYFLYPLKQKDLKHFLLPMGELTKKRAREVAEKLDLPVAKKASSQEICFVGDN